jgi:hypothetical protein
MRKSADSLTVFVDDGADLLARMAAPFGLSIEVREVDGNTSKEVVPRASAVLPPGPDGADELISELRDHGLEVVLEDGSWRAELLGLEVARIVRHPVEAGGDGALHIEAGVGRFDRDAAALMYAGESANTTLERAIDIVGRHRFSGAGTHALSLMARPRWLRSQAIADPASVGARHLERIQTSLVADSVRDQFPAAAVGVDVDGSPLLVVFGAGADLALVPVGADTRAALGNEHRLVFVLPTGDAHPAIRSLVESLEDPAELLEVEPDWA